MGMADDEPNGTAEQFEAAAGEGEGHVTEPLLSSDQLNLDRDNRLPWLDSSDDDYDYAGVDTGRVVAFVLAALALLGAIVGGIWWVSHRKSDASVVADGSTIPAPTQPYKEAPKSPGGKTFAGTGDTSYAVSQGKDGQPTLVGGGEAPKPGATTQAPQPAASSTPAEARSGGIGVQIGAYGSQATAEAAWTRLSGQSEALKGVSHRVVEGNADIGKVFRLQAVAGDDTAANALCSKLKAEGIACQVKR